MRKTTIVITALLTMSFAGTSIASPGQTQSADNSYCAAYSQSYNTMSEEQKAQVTERQSQMLEQRKQIIQKQVELGYITQEQADQRIAWMDQHINNGAMMGPDMMMNGSGRGMMSQGMGMMGSGMSYGMMESMVSVQRL